MHRGQDGQDKHENAVHQTLMHLRQNGDAGGDAKLIRGKLGRIIGWLFEATTATDMDADRHPVDAEIA